METFNSALRTEKLQMEHETEKGEETHAEHKKEKTITLKESTLWKIGFGVVVILLIIAVVTGGFGLKGKESSGQQAQQVAAGDQRVKVSADDDPVLGNKDAKVTVIEFSDFQCPFCRRYFTQTFAQLKKDYIDTGKIKYVFRDYPLPFHPAAVPYAIAADCAIEQGKFWEVHDKLYEEQNKQGTGTVDYLGADAVKKIAADLGLDATKFNECFASEKYKSEIEKDLAAGSAAGVSGTPTFFIGNDKKGYVALVGAQPYAAFQTAIDAEL